MSLFPVKVWVDSDEHSMVLAEHASDPPTFKHIHAKLYYVEARSESMAEERALELYMREEAPKHIHAHTAGSVIVERASEK